MKGLEKLEQQLEKIPGLLGELSGLDYLTLDKEVFSRISKEMVNALKMS